VYDPAFLIHAWERVRSNDGARTNGLALRDQQAAVALEAVDL
jgi:hypothetical protein